MSLVRWKFNFPNTNLILTQISATLSFLDYITIFCNKTKFLDHLSFFYKSLILTKWVVTIIFLLSTTFWEHSFFIITCVYAGTIPDFTVYCAFSNEFSLNLNLHLCGMSDFYKCQTITITFGNRRNILIQFFGNITLMQVINRDWSSHSLSVQKWMYCRICFLFIISRIHQ